MAKLIIISPPQEQLLETEIFQLVFVEESFSDAVGECR